MQVVEFIGAKGGQGTSTTASLFAIRSATRGVRTHLLAQHDDDLELAVLAGASAYDTAAGWSSLSNALTWGTKIPPDTELVVADGTIDETRQVFLHLPTPLRVLVVRNCFLALHRVMTSSFHFDRVVAIIEPARALNVSDMIGVLRHVDVTLSLDPAIARAVDAGLLHIRVPRSGGDLDVLLAPFEEKMCEFCHDNPAEPGVTHCDNTVCRMAWGKVVRALR